MKKLLLLPGLLVAVAVSEAMTSCPKAGADCTVAVAVVDNEKAAKQPAPAQPAR